MAFAAFLVVVVPSTIMGTTRAAGAIMAITSATLGWTVWRRLYRATPPRLMLHHLWMVVRLAEALFGVLFLVYVLLLLHHEPEWQRRENSSWVLLIPTAVFFACPMLATAANRGRVIALVGGLGKRTDGDEAHSAAAIGSLVGGKTTGDTLRLASGRFRVLPFSSMREADLANNTPASDLWSRTRPAKLGECDAFFSHSWHDAGALKWAVLSEWAAKFEETEGRPPTIWLDKVSGCECAVSSSAPLPYRACCCSRHCARLVRSIRSTRRNFHRQSPFVKGMHRPERY